MSVRTRAIGARARRGRASPAMIGMAEDILTASRSSPKPPAAPASHGAGPPRSRSACTSQARNGHEGEESDELQGEADRLRCGGSRGEVRQVLGATRVRVGAARRWPSGCRRGRAGRTPRRSRLRSGRREGLSSTCVCSDRADRRIRSFPTTISGACPGVPGAVSRVVPVLRHALRWGCSGGWVGHRLSGWRLPGSAKRARRRGTRRGRRDDSAGIGGNGFRYVCASALNARQQIHSTRRAERSDELPLRLGKELFWIRHRAPLRRSRS